MYKVLYRQVSIGVARSHRSLDVVAWCCHEMTDVAPLISDVAVSGFGLLTSTPKVRVRVARCHTDVTLRYQRIYSGYNAFIDMSTRTHQAGRSVTNVRSQLYPGLNYMQYTAVPRYNYTVLLLVQNMLSINQYTAVYITYLYSYMIVLVALQSVIV